MPRPDQRRDLIARLRRAGCVFAENEADLLLAAGATGLTDRLARRVAGEPLEHVLGWAEFAGLRVIVEAGVFVPRRRSELLVRQACLRLGAGDIVVDLCCGSGAIAAAIAARVPDAQVYASDVEPRAVACARRNLPPDQVFPGDLFEALPDRLRRRVDLLVVNAPYVPSDEVAFMPREARLYEPPEALDGGPDGLDWHRRIAAGAAGWLRPTGTLLIETSGRQAPTTARLLAANGFDASVVRADDLDATVAVGERR